MSKSRDYCFTVNNYTPEDETRIQAVECKYLVYGREIAPGTGTPHLQGYIYFSTQRHLTALKKKVHPTAHFEPAKGSAQQNRAYCTKDGNFFEKGEIPQAQGSRTDFVVMREAVAAGAAMEDLLPIATSYQSLRGAELLLKYQKPTKDRDVRVSWYWGPTGTGKTRSAFEECPDAWISGKNLNWFQAYTGQKAVIFDDFRGDFCEFHTLLRYLDRYPVNIENKGGSTWLRATRIIITSAYHPEHVYRNRTTEDIQQLMRRIHEVRYFPSKEPDA